MQPFFPWHLLAKQLVPLSAACAQLRQEGSRWQHLAIGLDLGQYNIAPYSLRRGGGVFGFLQHGSLETTLIRGRWDHGSTAISYPQEAVTASTELQIPGSVHADLCEAIIFRSQAA